MPIYVIASCSEIYEYTDMDNIGLYVSDSEWDTPKFNSNDAGGCCPLFKEDIIDCGDVPDCVY